MTCLERREPSPGVGAQGDGAEALEGEARAERSLEGGAELDRGQGIYAGTAIAIAVSRARDGEIGAGVGSVGGDHGAPEENQRVGTGQNLGARRRRSLGTERGRGKDELRLTVVPLSRLL